MFALYMGKGGSCKLAARTFGGGGFCAPTFCNPTNISLGRVGRYIVREGESKNWFGRMPPKARLVIFYNSIKLERKNDANNS